MMLECVRGEYQVTWVGHQKKAHDIKKWCNENFDPGWGSFSSTGTVDSGLAINMLVFKRLYHAQWCMMRWSD